MKHEQLIKGLSEDMITLHQPNCICERRINFKGTQSKNDLSQNLFYNFIGYYTESYLKWSTEF